MHPPPIHLCFHASPYRSTSSSTCRRPARSRSQHLAPRDKPSAAHVHPGVPSCCRSCCALHARRSAVRAHGGETCSDRPLSRVVRARRRDSGDADPRATRIMTLKRAGGGGRRTPSTIVPPSREVKRGEVTRAETRGEGGSARLCILLVRSDAPQGVMWPSVNQSMYSRPSTTGATRPGRARPGLGINNIPFVRVARRQEPMAGRVVGTSTKHRHGLVGDTPEFPNARVEPKPTETKSATQPGLSSCERKARERLGEGGRIEGVGGWMTRCRVSSRW